MALIKFPYGKELVEFDIPDERFAGSLTSSLNDYIPCAEEAELIEKALRAPVGSEPLCELAKGRKNVVIIASDHTRPVPSKLIIPPMLREIRKGNPDADVTILVATGCHRETTADELRAKFGREIFQSEHIVVHDCDDTENLVDIGELPSGGRLIINRLAAEADLLVSEGFIEPHFFAGFSGGRKSVLPGIASRKTVMYNHNSAFIADPCSRTGVLEGNPIHRDMLFAAKKAGLHFIVNTVLNAEHKVVYAAAGDVEKAHLCGCAFLSSKCGVSLPEGTAKPDIVITTNGGYPLDQNIYQAVKGMTAGEAAVRKGGVIIMLAKSDDGDGGKVFHETFKNCKDLNKMMEDFLATPPDETIIDQWQSEVFARVLLHAHVIYISDADDETVRDLHMIPAHSISEAVELADALLERNGSKILAIPDGIAVTVR